MRRNYPTQCAAMIWVRWLELHRDLESQEIQDRYIDGSFPMRSLVTAPIVIRISNEIKKGFVTYASGNSSPGGEVQIVHTQPGCFFFSEARSSRRLWQRAALVHCFCKSERGLAADTDCR
jgi:hypothetical protein